MFTSFEFSANYSFCLGKFLHEASKTVTIRVAATVRQMCLQQTLKARIMSHRYSAVIILYLYFIGRDEIDGKRHLTPTPKKIYGYDLALIKRSGSPIRNSQVHTARAVFEAKNLCLSFFLTLLIMSVRLLGGGG